MTSLRSVGHPPDGPEPAVAALPGTELLAALLAGTEPEDDRVVSAIEAALISH